MLTGGYGSRISGMLVCPPPTRLLLWRANSAASESSVWFYLSTFPCLSQDLSHFLFQSWFSPFGGPAISRTLSAFLASRHLPQTILPCSFFLSALSLRTQAWFSNPSLYLPAEVSSCQSVWWRKQENERDRWKQCFRKTPWFMQPRRSLVRERMSRINGLLLGPLYSIGVA